MEIIKKVLKALFAILGLLFLSSVILLNFGYSYGDLVIASVPHLLFGWLLFPFSSDMSMDIDWVGLGVSFCLLVAISAAGYFFILRDKTDSETMGGEKPDLSKVGVALFLLFLGGISVIGVSENIIAAASGRQDGMGPMVEQGRKWGFCGSLKSDLANLAIAQEAYFTDNDVYSDDIEQFKRLGWWRPTPTVGEAAYSLVLAESGNGFIATATNTKCIDSATNNRAQIIWDSTNGGLQDYGNLRDDYS